MANLPPAPCFLQRTHRHWDIGPSLNSCRGNHLWPPLLESPARKDSEGYTATILGDTAFPEGKASCHLHPCSETAQLASRGKQAWGSARGCEVQGGRVCVESRISQPGWILCCSFVKLAGSKLKDQRQLGSVFLLLSQPCRVTRGAQQVCPESHCLVFGGSGCGDL